MPAQSQAPKDGDKLGRDCGKLAMRIGIQKAHCMHGNLLVSHSSSLLGKDIHLMSRQVRLVASARPTLSSRAAFSSSLLELNQKSRLGVSQGQVNAQDHGDGSPNFKFSIGIRDSYQYLSAALQVRQINLAWSWSGDLN
jgi:hypothetical protein